MPRPVSVDQAGTLSGASTAGAVFGIVALPGAWPALLTVDATVEDVDRMHIRASSRPILVHPSDYYVGVRLAPESINVGLSDHLDVVVTDIDGSAVAGVPVTVDIDSVLDSERERDDAHVVDVQHCSVTSAAAPVACTFQRRDDAAKWTAFYTYTATARVVDRRGRANVAQYDVPFWGWKRDQPLSIKPDRPEYRPGDVAKLEVISDVVPATAIVSFARNGVIAQKRVELRAKSTTVELPIEPAFISNVSVDIDRMAPRRVILQGSKLPLPEHTQTSIDLPVSIEGARLVMTTKRDVEDRRARRRRDVRRRRQARRQASRERRGRADRRRRGDPRAVVPHVRGPAAELLSPGQRWLVAGVQLRAW